MGELSVGRSGAHAYQGHDDADAVCHAGPTAPTANGAGAASPATTTGPVVDSCETEDAPDLCQAWEYQPEHREWNAGQGPTKRLDREFALAERDRCMEEAFETYSRCLDFQKRDAEIACRGTDVAVGRGADHRPVTAGEREACVDARLHGTQETTQEDSRAEASSESRLRSRENTDRGGWTVSVGRDSSLASFEYGRSGETKDIEAGQRGTEKSSGRAESKTQEARPGTDELCGQVHEQETKRCGAQPWLVFP